MDNKKIMTVDKALSQIKHGARIMMGGFVGASEATLCINWLVENEIRDITLIAVSPGMNGFGKAKLYEKGLVKELISTHVGTTAESTVEYLKGNLTVKQFFPMGTWAEKVRAGAMGLGGVLVPVGIGILDEEGLFKHLESPKEVIEVNKEKYFVEPALTAEFSIVKAWRADELGNLEYRYSSLNCNPIVAMAGEYTIAEVEEIVPVGTIPPERVGTPAPFVNAIVKGLSQQENDELYRQHWLKVGKLSY